MSLQVEKLEGNMARLTIETSAEEFDKAIDKAYKKNKNKLSVPGFRKGKVPRKIIEKMYGNTVFYEDAANILIPSAYADAIDECTEEVVSQPKVEIVQVEEGKPFIFTAEVALKPEVTLGVYKGVEIEKADTNVTEEEIDEAVNHERENNARTISVEDRPVQDGDMIVLDFEGFLDGVAFEGGKGENYPLTIGSGTFIPGFEEQLIGAEIDKELTVSVTFPEDYQSEELKGKAAEFQCIVKEIKEKELPELDDEFASDVSEFDTMEEYRADLKEQLIKQKEETAEEEKSDKVVDAIIASSKMDIPKAMIETQQRQMVEDFARRIQMQGISFEQYLQVTGLTKADFMEQMEPQTIKRIQSRLVLDAIAKAENFEATEEEYQEEVQKMANAYHMSMEKFTDMMGKYEEKAVREDICIKKAIDFVVEYCVEK